MVFIRLWRFDDYDYGNDNEAKPRFHILVKKVLYSLLKLNIRFWAQHQQGQSSYALNVIS